MNDFDFSCQCQFFRLNYAQFQQSRGLPINEFHEYVRHQKKWTWGEWEQRSRALKEALPGICPEQVIYPGHIHYPPSFLHIDEPPLFLMFEGDVDLLSVPSISVVGSRRPEERFLLWMDTELKKFLEQSGVGVVSGGAWGVDQKASQVALRAGQGTVIVLPSGLQSPYPRGLKEGFQGPTTLFLSEYFPREEMFKGHFVRRNRIISALGKMLLAIQFEVKSGTMITVNAGLSQNKEVVTLPDHPLCGWSSGNLKVLREGARMVSTGEDLLDVWSEIVY